MKESNAVITKASESRVSLSLIPEDVLNSIITKQDKILDILSERKPPGLKGFLTEKEAMVMVNKKVTWFWQMRKTGRLSFKKIGKTTYYSTEDIVALLQR